MQASTLLLRQVHPRWIKEDGTAVSIAFWPFPKDKCLLSVDDGGRTSAAEAWQRFVALPGCHSAGVWGVLAGEAGDCGLAVREDPVDGNPFHIVVDFAGFDEKQQKAKAKMLSARANVRGCLYAAPAA